MIKENSDFQKRNLYNILSDLYNVSTAESQSLGTQKAQIFSNSITGLIIILTLMTLIYQLNKDRLITDVFVYSVIVFLLVIIITFFSVVILYYNQLRIISHRIIKNVQSIEELQKEIILSDITEKQLQKRIIKLFPYTNAELKKGKYFYSSSKK